MVIGVFYFELYLPGIKNRKEKRSIIASLKQRLKNGHNIAVSEVGFQDKLQRSAIGISTVCLKQRDAEKIFDGIYEQICGFFPVQLSRAEKEYY